MAKPSNAWTLWSQYLAARTASMVLTSFSVRTNLRTAAFFGRQMYRFDHRHRNRARNNLALAFPQWDSDRLDRVTAASFEHFVQLAVEVCHTPRLLHMDTWGRHTRVQNLAPAMRLLNRSKPAILLTGHLGNWEVLGYLLATLGFHIEALARPIDNPLINDWLLGIRQKRGLTILTKFDATDRMVQVLNNGGVLGFIADQNAGDKGLFVPFFGRLASTYKSIALLAMHQNVPIICGYAHRIKAEDQLGPAFRHELGVVDKINPEDWADRSDPLYYITARYVRAIETMVRMRPDQYLWMHRRWKSRPRFERLGQPMPRSLRKNLEHLPWMTQPTMDQLLASSDCKKTPGDP
jgi:KDO2-lipid IV(A) lauroyltransferase